MDWSGDILMIFQIFEKKCSAISFLRVGNVTNLANDTIVEGIASENTIKYGFYELISLDRVFDPESHFVKFPNLQLNFLS